MNQFYELKLLLKFSESAPVSSFTEIFREYIKQDSSAELFAGETCSQVLKSQEDDMSSAYLMSFVSGYEQQVHYHTGSRILFIFTKQNARASLGESLETMKEVVLEDSALYVLRMKKGVYHKFGGDFVAISVHPQDSITGSGMSDETTFV